MARRQCSKCGGTGRYCMGILDGRPYSRTGFTCYPCHGTGWVGNKTQKQLREQLASAEFAEAVAKNVKQVMDELEAQPESERPAYAALLAKVSHERDAKMFAEQPDMLKWTDQRLAVYHMRQQLYPVWEQIASAAAVSTHSSTAEEK